MNVNNPAKLRACFAAITILTTVFSPVSGLTRSVNYAVAHEAPLFYSSMEAKSWGDFGYQSPQNTNQWLQYGSDSKCDKKSARVTQDTGTEPDYIITDAFSTEGHEHLGLSFWYRVVQGIGPSDYVKAQWSTNGNDWYDIAGATFSNISNTAWRYVSLDLPDEVNGASSVRIRFAANLRPDRSNNNDKDEFLLDCIGVDGRPTPVCGNSIVESGEVCDDGNMVNNDGCSSTCQIDQICTDADGDGYYGEGTVCGTAADCDDDNGDVNAGVESDSCDTIDNDCDGVIDENPQFPFYIDGDGDGFGLIGGAAAYACAVPEGYVDDQSDCIDTDDAINPDMADACNGIDDDCDGDKDENGICGSNSYYCDTDGDGEISAIPSGSCDTFECVPAACLAAPGPDCDDSDSAINADAEETCDGIDNNCNADIDEGVKLPFYYDADGDNFGNSGYDFYCELPESGYAQTNGDCDDENGLVNPDAAELCNGIDDNCDGTVDEDLKLTFYFDGDNDGFGDAENTNQACELPAGYVTNDLDCNDESHPINPDAIELCNGVDDNCSGDVDEGLGKVFFKDGDGDGFGDSDNSKIMCSAEIGYVEMESDCDDENASVYPGNTEVCNGVDDSCDGNIDEGLSFANYYADADADGFGNPAIWLSACLAPESGYVINDSDCDDTDPSKTVDCPSGIDDGDGDGIADESDNCVAVPNPDQKNSDSDLLGDACDNCPNATNNDQTDADSDGIGDVCEADSDGDEIIDDIDNCLNVKNPGQEDSDGDKLGDACDSGDPSWEAVCGAANQTYTYNASGFGEATFCASGEVDGEPEFPAAGTFVTWNCETQDDTVECSAVRDPQPDIKPVAAGQCGAANGGAFETVPNEGLCQNGEPAQITGNGPWSWICAGLNGGSDALCAASLAAANNNSKPVCGNGKIETGEECDGDRNCSDACEITVFMSHPGDFARGSQGGGGILPSVAGAAIDLDEIERLINEIRQKVSQLAADIAARNGSVLGAATEVKTGVLD